MLLFYDVKKMVNFLLNTRCSFHLLHHLSQLLIFTAWPRQLSQRCSWKGQSGRVGVGDESTESCKVVEQLHVPLLIRAEHRTSVVFRWTNEMLCGG